MRESFPGYYRPSEDEFKDLWDEALIVPDTNVLLTLYRLPVTTRDQLLEILAGLQERLFLPWQVGAEFQRNRVNVIEEQLGTYVEIEKAIDDFAATVGKGVREHPRVDRGDLEARIAKALKPVRTHLEGLRQGHPDPLTDGDPMGPDAIRDGLDTLFAERIGEPRDLASLAEEGVTRYEKKIPPGFADDKKPEPDRYGDLAIWLDVIAKAKAEGKPVILVTEDRKPDWWSLRKGKALGPRPELIEEMREKASQRLWIYGLPRFMEVAADKLGIELNKDARDDVERAESAAQVKHVILSDSLIPVDRETTFVSRFGKLGEQLSAYGGGRVVFDAALEPPTGGFWSPDMTQRWVADVSAAEESALLAISLEPRWMNATTFRPANRLICRVRDPNGEGAVAARRDTSLSASFRYPDNFSGTESAPPGSYTYSWYFATGDEVEPTQIAVGGFELPGQKPGKN